MKKMSKKTKIILGILIALFIIIIGFVFFRKKKSQVPTDKQELIVTKQVLHNIIEISGKIEPAHIQEFVPGVDALIEKVYVKEGDVVKKGQPIFSLDSTEQRFALDSHDYTMKLEAIGGAALKLDLLRKQRDFLVKQVRDRTIRALFDGIIVSLKVNEGEYIDKQKSGGILIDRSYLKSTVNVSEFDANRLQIGQKVLFHFSALPDETIEGRVVSYPAIAISKSDDGPSAVRTDVRIDNPPDALLPGYSFIAKIIVGADSEVLLLSRHALRYEKGQPIVDKILENGRTEAVEVEVDAKGEFLEVLSGLQEGDRVKNQSYVNED